MKKLLKIPRMLRAVYYFESAWSATSKRDYSKALRQLARIEKIAPRYPYAMLLKSYVSLKTGRYEEAIRSALTSKKLVTEWKAPSETDKRYLRAYAGGCAFQAAKELGLEDLSELQFELEDNSRDAVDPRLKRNFPMKPKN